MSRVTSRVLLLCATLFGLFMVIGGKDCSADPWDKWRQQDVPWLSKEWSHPVYLEVSRRGWFESLFVAPDGQKLYMFHYPGTMDFVTLRMLGGPFTEDGDIHYSEWPFHTHQKLNKYFLSEDVFTEAGVSVDADGNFFYSTNREGRPGGKFPGEYDKNNIYRNGEFLAFNRREEGYDNPHYCEAMDEKGELRSELWFDCPMDQRLCVLENAKANNFSGAPKLAPFPINFRTAEVAYRGGGLTDYVNAQAFLTPDCKTLYFTSNRGRKGEGPWIYRSQRLLKEDEWSEPEVVVKGKIAVGDPSLTADGSQLFFVQFVMNDKINSKTGAGEMRTALYYVQRKGTEPTAATPPLPPKDPAPPLQQETAPAEGLHWRKLQGFASTLEVKAEEDQLVWVYTFNTGDKAPVLGMINPSLKTYKGLKVTLWSEQPTTMAFVLTEKGEVRYDYVQELSAQAMVTLELPWNKFSNQKETPDSNKRLDVSDVETFYFYDLGGHQGRKGTNALVIREFSGL